MAGVLRDTDLAEYGHGWDCDSLTQCGPGKLGRRSGTGSQAVLPFVADPHHPLAGLQITVKWRIDHP